METEEKYKIISEAELKVLAKRVNEEIRKGWEPIGGITNTATENSYGLFFQAMVKK